jgi:hypothetical protein
VICSRRSSASSGVSAHARAARCQIRNPAGSEAQAQTALVGHSNFSDPDLQIHFVKNVAMSGGFIFIAAFGAGAFTLAKAFQKLK